MLKFAEYGSVHENTVETIYNDVTHTHTPQWLWCKYKDWNLIVIIIDCYIIIYLVPVW